MTPLGRVFITPFMDFLQLTPENGVVATPKTDVSFGYLDQTQHVGVICHENHPEDIVVSSDGFASDSVAMVLDTFLNGQTGFAFGTNPNGREYDGSVADEYADWNCGPPFGNLELNHRRWLEN